MFSLLVSFAACVDPPAPYAPTPAPDQLKYHREEVSAFIHFGMNTFTGREVGTGTEDPDTFNPTTLDTDQWVSTFQKANVKRIILTAKHHDGFCLFDSKYTRHQVNESKRWRETAKKLGKSFDIFEEFSKSATKYNMDVGLYLSPWDLNSAYYGEGESYDEYYMNQLTELLSNKKYGNNGKFVEVWMDGWRDPSGKPQEYPFDRYFEHVWKLQPESTIFSIYDSPVRWSGTELGTVGDPSWSRINRLYIREWYDRFHRYNPDYLWNGDRNGDYYSLAECDVSLAAGGWFWTKGRGPKSMKEMADMYFTSVGLGEVFLFNIPPTSDGLFDQEYIDRVVEFGECVNNTFRLNLATLPIVEVSVSSVRGNDKQFKGENVIDQSRETYWTMNDNETTGWLEIDFNVPQVFDIISIAEHIPLGQRVSKFSVEVFLFPEQKWEKIGDFRTIGYKRLIRTTPHTATKVRFNITESLAVPLIESVGMFKAYGAFAL